MPFHLRFDARDLLRVRFAISPLWETQAAVRLALRGAGRGYHLPWLRRTRERAAALDLGPVGLLMPEGGHIPDFWSPPPPGPLATFEEELARVRATDPAVARKEMALALADTPGAARSRTGRTLLADPENAVALLADRLRHAWEVLVKPDWPQLRALLEADVAYRSQRLADGGLAALLGEFGPRVRWRDSTLTVNGTRGDHERVLEGGGLVLMPSVFVWPDLAGGYEEPWQPALIYPARGIGALWRTTGPDASEALARLLGQARARVLGALTDPASTTGLAERLGLAPSSVSAHLSALRGAGLLVSRRQGHRVLYERTPLGAALAAGGADPEGNG
ncbi:MULTISPECIES: ArsR/SmtB family transcription factor [unclassified Streptomyces]|uniref:ArsR/SmtB family transcription factor n=1 Tax=unclassified Streptomyces TaxID=2593676 RepID=UPI0004C4DCBE|nr:DUF5937 family protein [Streptomyces sp. NRRL F-5630]